MSKEDKKIEKQKDKGDILKVSTTEKYKTVAELFEKSQPNSVYYTLLILSVVIIVGGLLLQNPAIVTGGMLVTPLLTPILVIALAIAVGELRALKTPGILILKSVLITVSISVIVTLAFSIESIDQTLVNSLRTAILYFIIAAAAGSAATFAWVRKEVAEVLPGVSIAVALVPPLSLIGINAALLELEFVRFYLLIFLFNFVGIVLGSLIVFSLLKFQRASWHVQKKTEEIEKIQEEKKAEKIAEKAEEKMAQVQKNIEKMKKIEEERGKNIEN